MLDRLITILGWITLLTLTAAALLIAATAVENLWRSWRGRRVATGLIRSVQREFHGDDGSWAA